MERVAADLEVDAVAGEIGAVLLENAALGGGEDLFEILGGERLAGDAHRQAPDELRLESVRDEILAGDLCEVVALGALGAAGGAEADGGALHAAFDLVGEFVERAADDEEDVPGVDLARTRRAAALHLHHRLHLAEQVGLAVEGDIGFLHELEQVDLHAAAGDIAAGEVLRGGDLVDLVDVDDAVLGQLDIAIGRLHEVAHEVLDIAADIAGLGKLRRVGLHERHADELGDAAHEVGFADAGGAEEDDVLLGVVALAQLGAVEALAHVVVVVADGDGEDLLGVVLFDDEAVEVVADFAGPEVEGADAAEDFGVGVVGRRGGFGGAAAGRGLRWGMGGHHLAHGGLHLGIFEELLHLAFELLERVFRAFVAHGGRVSAFGLTQNDVQQ